MKKGLHMAQDRRCRFGTAWRGLQGGASIALNVVLVAYITFYCTDILGLKAGVIGTLLLTSKVIDAFTDLGVGYLIDRTHTRFGKARPYEIFIVFDWIFTILLFNVPDGSQIFQYAWVFIMYVLINAICRTALGGVDSVYMARTFTTAKNQINAMTVNGIISMAKGNGQWQDRSYEPSAGDIIFFDWEGDGETDHVGIVEKCENGIVYTVEGNSGDACKQNQYSVGSSSIYGYGVPAY